MDLMSGLAAQAMDLSAMRFAQSYSIAVTKKVMDGQEQALQAILEMMPPTPAVQMGEYIDTYA